MTSSDSRRQAGWGPFQYLKQERSWLQLEGISWVWCHLGSCWLRFQAEPTGLANGLEGDSERKKVAGDATKVSKRQLATISIDNVQFYLLLFT